jgi:NAD(P)H-dependent FMN reductase
MIKVNYLSGYPAIATNLLDILDNETIASKTTGIEIDEVKKHRLSNENKHT